MVKTTFLHSDWEFAEEGWITGGHRIGNIASGWLPAQVPGHVHLDLFANKVIADPLAGMNELGCQWVDERDWHYRTTFQFEPDPSLPRRVLQFEGLDTVAAIYLNGNEIGRSRNMFVPLELDVTDDLRSGSNEIEVRFTSAVNEGNRLRAAYLEKEGIAPSVRNFDDRAFIRKAQYMYGWDWGPRLVSCGIWRPVKLIEFASRILDVHVTQEWHDDGSVTVRATAEVEGDGEVVYSLTDDDECSDGVFELQEPKLWWPNGLGEPWMYALNVHLKPFGAGSDSRIVHIGLRRIKLLREPDQFGESFEFEVNGRRVWVRGANWIPDHSFPSVVSFHRYKERIDQAQEMGCNMLRVWGGGLYETDEFYWRCDKSGILVWQDFPFACSYYPEDEEFQREVAYEALTNIKRLRQHPSLALWCGNNENHMMRFAKWGGPDGSPPRYYGLDLYRNTIPAVLTKADPGRPYIESSPVAGSGDSDDVDPNLGGSGDQHCWDVWHGRGDWRYYADSTARFCSEYGFASAPSRSVLEKAVGQDKHAPNSQIVAWHDKTGKSWEQFSSLVKLHYPEPESLDDWIYYSQLNQRDAIRFGLEHYRRSQFCRGSLIWQLNDCWPVQSWALVDFDGNYKAAAYELQRLHQETLCSIVRNKELFELWIVNDSAHDQTLPVKLEVIELSTGNVLRTKKGRGAVPPGKREKLLEVSISGLPAPDLLVRCRALGPLATWQLAAEPKNARFGPPRPITISTHHHAFLEILTDGPVVDLRLTSNGSTRPFARNFVTLAGGTSELLEIKGPIEHLEPRSLAGVHPVKLVRGPL